MGGAIAEGNQTPSAEYNVWVDPEAAARVFAGGLDVTMVGLDVTNRAVLTPAHADRLRTAGAVGAAVAGMLDVYGTFYEETYDHGGCPVHDALALARSPARSSWRRSTAASRSTPATASAAAALSSTCGAGRSCRSRTPTSPSTSTCPRSSTCS